MSILCTHTSYENIRMSAYLYAGIMGSKPGRTRPSNIFAKRRHYCFCPPNFCMQVQFFYLFYYLKLVNTNLGWTGDTPPIFSPEGH